MKIGVISDTHGHIHEKVFRRFEDVDLIIHAGDIGSEDILTELETLAPVKAVFGNTDTRPVTANCNKKEIIHAEGKKIYVTHMVIEAGIPFRSVMNDIRNESPDIVVFGHTHNQHAEIIEGILFFNPGGGGRKRFGKRLGIGFLTLNEHSIDHEIIYLE